MNPISVIWIFCIWDALQTLLLILLAFYAMRLKLLVKQQAKALRDSQDCQKEYKEQWYKELQRADHNGAALYMLEQEEELNQRTIEKFWAAIVNCPGENCPTNKKFNS